MAPLGLLIAACAVPPFCLAAAGGLYICISRRRRSSATSMLSKGVNLPTTQDGRSATPLEDKMCEELWPGVPLDPSTVRGPHTTLSKSGRRVLARRGANVARQPLPATLQGDMLDDRGETDAVNIDMIEVLHREDGQGPYRQPNEGGQGRKGLRRRSVTWTAQGLDGLSLSGYLPASSLIAPPPAAQGAQNWFAFDGLPSSMEGTAETIGHGGGSQESATELLDGLREMSRAPSFQTDVLHALGINFERIPRAFEGQRSPDVAEPAPVRASSPRSGRSLPEIRNVGYAELPSRDGTTRRARRRDADDTYGVRFESPVPGRKELSEVTQHTMISLDRWEAYSEVQAALKQLRTALDAVAPDASDYAAATRRKGFVPCFAGGGSSSPGHLSEGDLESELEAAREQEQRSAERMFEHARRPISWLIRQTSSGTLPDGVMSVGNLAVRAPSSQNHRDASKLMSGTSGLSDQQSRSKRTSRRKFVGRKASVGSIA